MALVDALRAALGDGEARSFRLMGEDLAVLTGAALREAAAAYEEALERLVPAHLRARFEAEQAAVLREAHGWLRRHNRSMQGRIRGYLALARRSRFEYPWPVVAVLGICQVMGGIQRNRLYGLMGRAASRFGWRDLEQLADGVEDVLRRTNRGIFADSVPPVLLGLRCRELRLAGEGELADALGSGPPPLVMDEESHAIARDLCTGLGIERREERFTTLAALTARHFAREQAIFTHHIGSPGRRRGPVWMRRLTSPTAVLAPAVERGRLVFRRFPLPAGFEMGDHAARVAAFERAFVASVTSRLEDYEVAARWVENRFGKS